MDVSHLQVKVTSEGVDKVSRQLGGLGNSAANAEVKVTKLTDTITKLIGMQGKLGAVQQSATSLAQNQANVFASLHSVMGQVAQHMAAATTATNALATAMQNVTTHAHGTGLALQRKSHWGNVATSTLKAMVTAASAYLGLNMAKAAVNQADAWAMMQAKLKLSTGTMQEARTVQGELFELSQKIRVPLEDMGKLFNRMAVPMEKMGKSVKDTEEHIEYLALALKLGGATAGEASSAMLQYSQSINAGRLNGAEFNAIAEAAPSILRNIEKELRATGQWGKHTTESLKELGSQGGITFELMQRAAERALPQMRKDFEELPLTVDGAVQRIKNAWLKAMGEMGEDTKLGQRLAALAKQFEEMIPVIRDGMVTAVEILFASFKTLAVVIAALTATKLVNWLIESAVALRAAWAAAAATTAAVTAAGGAASAAAGGFTILRTAVSFLGGPIGIIAGLLAAGVTAWMAWGNSAKESAEVAKKSMVQEGDEIVANLDRQIAALERRNKLVEAGVPKEIAKGDTPDKQKLAEYYEEMQQVIKAEGKWANFPNAARVDYLRVISGRYTELLEKVEKLNKLQNASDNHVKENKIATVGKEFDKEFGTKQMKAAEEIEEWKRKFAEAGKEFTAVHEKMIRDKFKLDKGAESEAESLTKRAKSEVEAVQTRAAAEATAASMIGKSAVEQAWLKSQLILQEQTLTEVELRRAVANKTATSEQKRLLEELLAAKERLANAEITKGYANEEKKDNKDEDKRVKEALEAAESLDKALNSMNMVKFGNDFKEAFGKAGKAIGTVVDAFQKMEQRQAKINKLKEDYNKAGLKGTAAERQMTRIREEETKAQLDSYADMAGAAKGFFDEKSKGYKAMEAAEKVFRAFEMAMEVKSFLMKMGFIQGITTAKVVGDQQVATSAVTSAGTQVAAEQTVGMAKATTAVVNQGSGDPYSAFVRIAAMAALMAAMGFATGAFGGGGDVQGPTTNTGTGTVFGDPTAQSESIANSIELLSDIDKMTMRYSAQMANSLSNIEASMVGLVTLVLRDTSGLASGANFGVAEGKIRNDQNPFDFLGIAKPLDDFISNSGIVGHIHGALIRAFSSVSTEITSAGLFIQGQLRALQQGAGMQQYADVKVTESSFWGLDKDTSYQTLFARLDPSLARQFGLVISNIVDSVQHAGEALGRPSAQIEQALNSMSLNLGRIDLRGMTGEQIQERLEAVFGAAADTIAREVVPGFESFQKVGEGYFETIVRVSTGVEQAAYELDKLGIAAVNVDNVINKQGDIGAEIVKQSLMIVEAGTGIGEIINTLTGTAAEIAETYATLAALRRAMEDVGLGVNLGIDAIRAAGGLEALQDAVAAYTEGFFSDAEKRAIATQNLTEDFGKLGLALPASRAAFRALVESLQAGGNNTLATQVLLLADAFASLTEESAEQAADAVTDARDALTTSYEREREALESTKEKFESFADSLREFRSSLLMGELSTLTNAEKYASLRDQFQSTASAALSGDQSAIDKFQDIANEFLTFSREFNASGDQYMSDFNAVLAATDALETFAEGQVTQAEQQITLLEQQVSGLIEINESVLTVTEAIAALHLALANPELSGGALTVTPAAALVAEERAATIGDSQIPREQAMSAMTDELRAMRAELAALREQQANETAAVIASNYDANEQNAAAINDAANSSAYSERTQVAIA